MGEPLLRISQGHCGQPDRYLIGTIEVIRSTSWQLVKGNSSAAVKLSARKDNPSQIIRRRQGPNFCNSQERWSSLNSLLRIRIRTVDVGSSAPAASRG
jgi:hypothetical protein